MKKVLLSLLVAIMLLPMQISFAADYEDDYKSFTVRVNEQILDGEDPIVKNGRMSLPFKSIFSALGFEVNYDKAKKSIVATSEKQTISMSVGKKSAIVTADGVSKTVPLSTAPFVEKGTTFVPVRDIAQMSGLQVDYSPYAEMVNVYDEKKLIEDIDKDLKILNTILKNSPKKSMLQVYKLMTNIKGDFSVYDENQNYKFGGELKIEGLARALDFNGKFNVTLNSDDIAKMEPERKAQFEELKKMLESEHKLIINSKSKVAYVKSNLLSFISENAFDSSAWAKFSVPEEFSANFSFDPSFTDSLLKNPDEITMGNILYKSAKNQNNEYITVYEQVYNSGQILKLFFGDEGMKKDGDNYSISLNKNSITSRLEKYFSRNLMNSLNEFSSINIETKLLNVSSSNPGLDLKVSVKATSGTEVSASISGDNTTAKMSVTAVEPNEFKAVINMDSTSTPTGENIQLAPPSGEKVVDLG